MDASDLGYMVNRRNRAFADEDVEKVAGTYREWKRDGGNYIDPRKLTEYVLCPDNPKGKHKALMFQRYLGYTPDNYEALLVQIQSLVLNAEAIPQNEDRYGRRYQIDLEIYGTQPEQLETVRTGWLVPPNSRQARLITAYIKRKP